MLKQVLAVAQTKPPLAIGFENPAQYPPRERVLELCKEHSLVPIGLNCLGVQEQLEFSAPVISMNGAYAVDRAVVLCSWVVDHLKFGAVAPYWTEAQKYFVDGRGGSFEDVLKTWYQKHDTEHSSLPEQLDRLRPRVNEHDLLRMRNLTNGYTEAEVLWLITRAGRAVAPRGRERMWKPKLGEHLGPTERARRFEAWVREEVVYLENEQQLQKDPEEARRIGREIETLRARAEAPAGRRGSLAPMWVPAPVQKDGKETGTLVVLGALGSLRGTKEKLDQDEARYHREQRPGLNPELQICGPNSPLTSPQGSMMENSTWKTKASPKGSSQQGSLSARGPQTISGGAGWGGGSPNNRLPPLSARAPQPQLGSCPRCGGVMGRFCSGCGTPNTTLP